MRTTTLPYPLRRLALPCLGIGLLNACGTPPEPRPEPLADLLLLTVNPLEDILHTRTLQTVIHDGHVVEGIVAASRPGGGS